MKKKLFIYVVTLLLLIGLAASFNPSAISSQSPSAPFPPLATLPADSTIEVMGVWGGEEAEGFRAMVASWEQQTGARMNYFGTRDIFAMQRAIQSDNPPDAAILPLPGLVNSLARDGNIMILNSMLDMNVINQQYSQTWLDIGSVNGQLYALPMKAVNKAIIWYNPRTFSSNGWALPETWDEMIALSDTIVSDNKVPAYPWAVGVEDGAASGWPGTDWIAQIFLSRYGAEVYDQWVNHQIPWTDPRIKDAWEMWGDIVYTDGYVAGGATAALATNFQVAPSALFVNPPQAAMSYGGDFVQGLISARFPDLAAGQDYSFFPFPVLTETATPPVSPAAQRAVTGGADLVVVCQDIPAVRSFVSYLASPQAQSIWVERGGFISVNAAVALSAYPNELARKSAEDLLNASSFRFGAGDSMPTEVQTAWWSGILQYLQNRDALDGILQNIENTAAAAYQPDSNNPPNSP